MDSSRTLKPETKKKGVLGELYEEIIREKKVRPTHFLVISSVCRCSAEEETQFKSDFFGRMIEDSAMEHAIGEGDIRWIPTFIVGIISIYYAVARSNETCVRKAAEETVTTNRFFACRHAGISEDQVKTDFFVEPCLEPLTAHWETLGSGHSPVSSGGGNVLISNDRKRKKSSEDGTNTDTSTKKKKDE
jgi:hypothetical protein